MTAVNWSEVHVADDLDPLTLENLYRKYGNWAGIHGFEFTDHISGFGNNWDFSAAPSAAGGATLSSGLDSEEGIVWYGNELPHAYAFEFTAHQGKWAAFVRGDYDTSYYRIDYDFGGFVSVSYINQGEVERFVSKALPGAEAFEKGRVFVSVIDAQFNSVATGRIIKIGVWINGYPVITFADNVYEAVPGRYMAMVVPANVEGALYSDFRIGDLSEVVQWSSLDPGEAAAGAIGRTVEDRYLRLWMRWNGKLKVIKPKARAVSAIIPTNRQYTWQDHIDTRQAISHLRVVGAFQWVQLIDEDMLKLVGHRFREINNTSAWSTDDCETIGRNIFIRAREQVVRVDLSTQGFVLLEPEDRITRQNVRDYIVDNISWRAEKSGYQTSISGREYLYGDPE